MIQTLTLPSLNSIPDDIDEHLYHLLNEVPWQASPDPAIADWLLELIKNSGHLSTNDDLRWRVLGIIWLAAQFDVDKAWPYLMWLNMNQPLIGDHLGSILTEAADDFDCHVQLATWIAGSEDDRLITFFSEFQPMPGVRKLPAVLSRLLARPTAPETGIWLGAFCNNSAGHVSPHFRRWSLVAAAWYATCFNPNEGLLYLQKHTNEAGRLTPADNKLLMDTAGEFNGVSPLLQWIAACPDPAVKTMLKDFGHPDLAAYAQERLQAAPDYDHLAGLAGQAEVDAQTFQETVKLLEQSGISLESARILDLACGILAPHTVLLNSAGFKTTGVDLHIPPAYLPLPGLTSWFRRRKHIQSWQVVTAPYYEALAAQAGLKLKWGKVNIELADLTRLQFGAGAFSLVICLNYLQHAPDVESLLAEAARVLQPGGLFLADILPYPALTGAFQAVDSTPAWNHLLDHHHNPSIPLNKWRESQYRAALEKHFTLDQWLTEPDEAAVTELTPEIRADLADYSAEELTRKRVVVLARKK
jgi:SAM-dependent methyltransferase